MGVYGPHSARFVLGERVVLEKSSRLRPGCFVCVRGSACTKNGGQRRETIDVVLKTVFRSLRRACGASLLFWCRQGSRGAAAAAAAAELVTAPSRPPMLWPVPAFIAGV